MQHLKHLVERHGAPEIKALDVGAARRTHLLELFDRLDALCRGGNSEARAEARHARTMASESLSVSTSFTKLLSILNLSKGKLRR